MSLCWLFGHAPTISQKQLERELPEKEFKCFRCGEMIPWSGVHPTLQYARMVYLKNLKINPT